ncbi:hypothetical protein C2G38_2226955 [Gigaspora rosea]|uniref:Uncharacterized protein n=1 Tax=Gigaspora rosea TaxID=44941 RepID=A0A397U5Z2_9GLOM|nr:hypothetical protein C2G38_2226955 [Gigaspora rosea]
MFKYCKIYLKNCPNFLSKYTKEERAKILASDKKEVNLVQKKLRTTYANTDSNISLPSSSIQTKMVSYIGWPLSTKDIPTFNSLLLRMTISNGFSFSWIENEETKEFFKFITPGLVLPSRRKLSNSILKEATKKSNNK